VIQSIKLKVLNRWIKKFDHIISFEAMKRLILHKKYPFLKRSQQYSKLLQLDEHVHIDFYVDVHVPVCLCPLYVYVSVSVSVLQKMGQIFNLFLFAKLKNQMSRKQKVNFWTLLNTHERVENLVLPSNELYCIFTWVSFRFAIIFRQNFAESKRNTNLGTRNFAKISFCHKMKKLYFGKP
jgi:predicted RNase H-like nuclease